MSQDKFKPTQKEIQIMQEAAEKAAEVASGVLAGYARNGRVVRLIVMPAMIGMFVTRLFMTATRQNWLQTLQMSMLAGQALDQGASAELEKITNGNPSDNGN